MRIAQNKYFANRILEHEGIPVPKAVLLEKDTYEEALLTQQLDFLRFPLVVKPLNEGRGTGVLCNIQTLDELKSALNQGFEQFDTLIIEEFHAQLTSYRVLVFNQRVLSVVVRHPASIIGDGEHTIEELVALENKERQKINAFLGPILLDTEAQIRFKERGIDKQYIPATGEKIVLAYTSNATRGGSFETFNQKICKENSQLMCRAANVLNLKIVGIDVECADISKPMDHARDVLIEINKVPSVRIHELPMRGRPHLVTRKIIRYFIYRHPIAYLYSLYFNKQTAFYIKSFIVTVIVGLIYWLGSDISLP